MKILPAPQQPAPRWGAQQAWAWEGELLDLPERPAFFGAPFVTVLDEYAFFAPQPSFQSIFRSARSFGFSATLATQSLDDFLKP